MKSRSWEKPEIIYSSTLAIHNLEHVSEFLGNLFLLVFVLGGHALPLLWGYFWIRILRVLSDANTLPRLFHVSTVPRPSSLLPVLGRPF